MDCAMHMPSRKRLFTPGPTPIPDRVRRSMADPPIYHRGPEFPALLRGVVHGLKRVFPSDDELFVLSSSGTGAMEAAVVNTLSSGDRVLVAQAGLFGARWAEICRTYGIEVEALDFPWGAPIEADAIQRRLEKDAGVRAVLTTQSETSTGALHDIEAIGEVVRRTDALLIVDGVSSVGAHPLPTNAWGVDVGVTASQKGLMTPPGLGMITMGARAFEASKRSDLSKYYLDLNRYRQALSEGRGPATLPVTLLPGLASALDMIFEEGLEAVWERHARHANAVRAAACALGLSLLAERPSNALTAIALPEGLDGAALVDGLRHRHGVITGGGVGRLKGRLIRISNLGYVDDVDILTAVSALEMGLKEESWTFRAGSGVGAAEVVLAGNTGSEK